MNSLKYVGLIECKTRVMPYKLDSGSRMNGFQLKKVLINKNATEQIAKNNYPEAEIVRNLDSIIDDQTIELVIVSGNRNDCLDQVAQALKAGKYIRMVK